MHSYFESGINASLCSYRLLHSDRDAIPDVPAVYFVLPTEENIKRICQVVNSALLQPQKWINLMVFPRTVCISCE